MPEIRRPFPTEMRTQRAAMSLEQIVLLLLGALAAGLVNGLTGFGTAITALPIWLYVFPPTAASTLAIICAMVSQLQTLPMIWPHIRWRLALPLVVPGIIGRPGRNAASASDRAEIFQAWGGGISDRLFGVCAAATWQGRAPSMAARSPMALSALAAASLADLPECPAFCRSFGRTSAAGPRNSAAGLFRPSISRRFHVHWQRTRSPGF